MLFFVCGRQKIQANEPLEHTSINAGRHPLAAAKSHSDGRGRAQLPPRKAGVVRMGEKCCHFLTWSSTHGRSAAMVEGITHSVLLASRFGSYPLYQGSPTIRDISLANTRELTRDRWHMAGVAGLD